MTKEQFASLLKSKNPKWASVDNDTLVNSILERYPSYRERITGSEAMQTMEQPAEQEKQSFMQEAGQDIKQTFGALKNTASDTQDKIDRIAEREVAGEQGKLRSFGQAFGTVARGISGGIGDLFVGAVKTILPEKQEEAVKQKTKQVFSDVSQAVVAKHEKMKIEDPENAAKVEAALNTYRNLDEKTKADVDALLGVSALAFDIATAGTTKKIVGRGITEGAGAVEDVAKQVVKRTFDTTKSTAERIKNVRNILPKSVNKIDDVGVSPKQTFVQKFTENPSVSGALEDIKIMVGLPESTPAVDMTFRAVKPRIKKGMNLRRSKAQMELANQTIVENGFKPTSLKDYADAVYDTKKKVWEEINKNLQLGQDTGKEIDLVEIAIKILDRAEDPALLRTNPNAAKQLTTIAENLVQQGNDVGILEAERMKQLLNAELDGLFGELDLSKQAKEAKKLITREIGDQLNKKLSDLPDEFKGLKTKYGSLSSIEDDILKRAIVFERQNPEGLADILTKTEAAAELVFGNTKSRLRAIARLTMGNRLKKANDANELIKRAFEKLSSSR